VDCSILLKSGRELAQVTADIPRPFKIKGSKVKSQVKLQCITTVTFSGLLCNVNSHKYFSRHFINRHASLHHETNSVKTTSTNQTMRNLLTYLDKNKQRNNNPVWVYTLYVQKHLLWWN